MHTITLLNTPECPCPGTHYAACMEFLHGFTEFGFTIGETNTSTDCKDKTIIVLSSHVININYLNELNVINPSAVYILWYYHSVFNSIPFKKFILTGEHFIHPPLLQSHIRFHTLNISIPNFVPLYLRANESPKNIGTYERSTIVYDGCFMGSAYKYHWVSTTPNILYHSISNGLLTSDQRKDIYLKSKIAFGFHHNDNITNSHVTQRVFEGLTYGCVVISDNKAAADYTGGIVEYASSKEEFHRKFKYLLDNPEIMKEKQEKGYEWAKQYGTNRYAASAFLDKIKELWGLL
jgi:hypothetical protein